MCWHIITSLQSVLIIWFILLHQPVHDLSHVVSHIRVGVLIDGERTGGVLDKEVKQSHLRQWLRQMTHHLSSDEMEASASCFKCEFYLSGHFTSQMSFVSSSSAKL